MIHPHTRVLSGDPAIGVGVYATRPIPRGTIVVVRDRFDMTMSPEAFLALPEPQRAAMETYMYHDKCGNLVLSWDHARYMNHNCLPSTMMTDYDLEIAVRDIAAGEELTTEYGLLNIQEPYAICCGCEHCREHLRLDDIDVYGDEWDVRIRESLACIPLVEQPLLPLMTGAPRARLDAFLTGKAPYSSVRNLKWLAEPVCGPDA
ncbi:nuclear protein SET [Pseudodesulfovibrio mercurii]|uniref:Nuclear protein SET n=1 Tax=Pseudodesulfovibrio mercurii TaxID=641491 RepID=F0JBY5_9BACT|nr:SET domain-containing protein [Pseudodesulfovibrio mercurii]EGB14378.1 nuclear protein SET [Pseudodesulfovibrio mercurii]